MLDSDTAVRRYGLNTGLGCNVRLKEICSTSRNLHPLELGQNGANSRPQHFWFGRTWFHREKVVHIGPPPSGVPPKNITWGTFGKTGITFRSVVRFGWNFYGRFSTRFQFFLQPQRCSEKSQKNKKKSGSNRKMGLKCFSSFWNNLNSFCKPHQASVVGENSCGYISFGHNDVRFCPL